MDDTGCLWELAGSKCEPFRFSDPCDAVVRALIAAQGEFPEIGNVAANEFLSTTARKVRYAPLAELIKVTRPALVKQELGFLHGMASLADGGKRITMRLMHASGQWIEMDLDMTPTKMGRRRNSDDEDVAVQGGAPTPQALGSVFTYGKRYTYKAMLGIEGSEEDDDGNAASGVDGQQNGQQNGHSQSDSGGRRSATAGKPVTAVAPKVSAEQVAIMRKRLAETSSDEAAFCQYLQVMSLEDMPASHFIIASAKLDKKEAEIRAKKATPAKDEPGADG